MELKEFLSEENLSKSFPIIRRFLGFTQEKFANELGISRKMIVQLENNKDFNHKNSKLEIDDHTKEIIKQGLNKIIQDSPEVLKLISFLFANEFVGKRSYDYIMNIYNLEAVLDLVKLNYDSICEAVEKIISNNKKMRKKRWLYILSAWDNMIESANKILVDFKNENYLSIMKFYAKNYIENLLNFVLLYKYQEQYARCLHISNLSRDIQAQENKYEMFSEIGIEINADYDKFQLNNYEIVNDLIKIRDRHEEKLLEKFEELIEEKSKTIPISRKIKFLEENSLDNIVSNYTHLINSIWSFANVCQHDNFRFLLKCKIDTNKFEDKLTEFVFQTNNICTKYFLDDVLRQDDFLDTKQIEKIRNIKNSLNNINPENEFVISKIFGKKFKKSIFDLYNEKDDEE